MEDQISRMLERNFPEESLRQEVLTVGRLKKVSAENLVISPGSETNEMPMVISGLLKVFRQDENGNELFLYYLEGGEACAMSISCCVVGRVSQFKVVAEDDSVLWMIPLGNLDRWIEKYRSFRSFVFQSYQTRFDELLETIDSVTFTRLDERLYKYLLDQKQATGTFVINKTHEKIAGELNTSRVVISRLLKKLEKEEKIEQYRNRIEIL
jgi:CRP/FNR family transcriptional regulator